MRDGSEGEDENDYDLPSGIKLGLENAYTSNKSKRGNHTDRKSVQNLRPSQSVLNMLVQKDKILANEYKSGSLSPKRMAQKQYEEAIGIPSLTMPIMKRQ